MVADRCLGHSMHQLISCGCSHLVSHSSTSLLVGHGVASMLSTLYRRSQDFRCRMRLHPSLCPLPLFFNNHHFQLIQLIGPSTCLYSLTITTIDLFSYSTQLVLIIQFLITSYSLFSYLGSPAVNTFFTWSANTSSFFLHYVGVNNALFYHHLPLTQLIAIKTCLPLITITSLHLISLLPSLSVNTFLIKQFMLIQLIGLTSYVKGGGSGKGQQHCGHHVVRVSKRRRRLCLHAKCLYIRGL